MDLTAANTFADQDFGSSIHRDQVLFRTCRIASNISKIKFIRLNVWSALFGLLVLASILL